MPLCSVSRGWVDFVTQLGQQGPFFLASLQTQRSIVFMNCSCLIRWREVDEKHGAILKFHCL